MKSTFQSQIWGEFWSIAKTNFFKTQTEKQVYMYKITTFISNKDITREFGNCKN